MKLSGNKVARFVRNPDPHIRGALIYGDDPALVSARRDQLSSTILGEDSPELRLTRLEPSAIRKDSATLFDALRESGFFGGRRVVQIDGATDGLAKILSGALDDIAENDAFLVVSAGSLPARSKLRAIFEPPSTLVALPCYSDSVQTESVSEALLELGLQLADADAEASLRAQRADLDYGAYQQLLAKLATYKMGDALAVTAQDVLECSPLPDDPESHSVATSALSGDVDQVACSLSRLKPDASSNASLLIAMSWQAKRLYSMVSAVESGVPREKALAALRPPVFGDARARLSRQLGCWSVASLESALRLIHEAQLSSRSAGGAQPDAATSRTILRITMMAARN